MIWKLLAYYLSQNVPPLLFCQGSMVVMDHKSLVAMINKDITTLAHQLQYNMVYIHQYSMHILYKPDPHPKTTIWKTRIRKLQA